MKTKLVVVSVPCPVVDLTRDGQNVVVNAQDVGAWTAQGWIPGKAKAPVVDPGANGGAGSPGGDNTQTGEGTPPGGASSGQGKPETKASEAALALMKANAVDPSLVKGTGKDGNITKGDVEAYLATAG
jgi:pyruvate/2-oxoglutarate dehydrogenase complex dihydrolipoamide acyltransferase (E2) component